MFHVIHGASGRAVGPGAVGAVGAVGAGCQGGPPGWAVGVAGCRGCSRSCGVKGRQNRGQKVWARPTLRNQAFLLVSYGFLPFWVVYYHFGIFWMDWMILVLC